MYQRICKSENKFGYPVGITLHLVFNMYFSKALNL